VIAGGRFFKNGRLDFPKNTPVDSVFTKKDGSYHTCFGPCVAHSGVVYGNTDPNVSLATTRLTKSRLPTIPGFEVYLQDRQRSFIVSHSPILDSIKRTYTHHFDTYTDSILEALEHHGDSHPKAPLRIAAWKDIIDYNLIDDDLWNIPSKGTLYKMKIFEIAKPNKVPRMIGDLGVHASLQGFRITKFIKAAMATEPIEYMGGTIEFCPKPDPASLEAVFAKLIDPPSRFYFVYFSDDSCLSIRVGEDVLRFNVDISSCDASHTGELFDLIQHMVPDSLASDMSSLIKQCQTPITIHSRADPRNHVTLRPSNPRLYSGSTLTTAINNLANLLIALSVAESDCTNAQDVISAAAAAGYIVTCDDCTDWHKLQFLKHSPVLDETGHLRPLLNIGVLLRLSGTCKGDLPGSKKVPLSERAASFQASLLNGAYPKAHFTLLDNMSSTCGRSTPLTDAVVAKIFEHKVLDTDDYPHFRVRSDEVFRRYELDALGIAQVELGFGLCKYSEHYSADGTSTILLLDYGLSGKELV